MGCVCGKEVLEINGSKYIVRGRLGEGGFSYVDLVEGMYNHKLYAVKRINTSTREDEKLAMQEIEFHKSIKHPNVIDCIEWTTKGLDAGVGSQEVLLVLPFYKRGTLQDEINNRFKKNDPFSETTILQLFKDICEGVRAFHESTPTPIAHRDLKLGNILMSDDFRPVLMDFGSAGPAYHEVKSSAEAKAFEDMAAQHCTMMYRAPEFFHLDSDSILDERTDIWSLGCVLYAMCFFKSPFETAYERGGSIALAVIGGIIDIPKDSPYSQELHQLILGMLKVDHRDRPFIHDILKHVNTLINENRAEEC